MLRLARRLGVKARVASASAEKPTRLPLRAIGEGRDGSFFLIAAADEPSAKAEAPGRLLVLVQTYDSDEPRVWTEHELLERWSGRLILMTTREAMAGARRTFDVTWFLAFIVKYRKPLIQVLAASFVIQIVGLISPVADRIGVGYGGSDRS